jgi:hypothetical protein
MAQRLLSLLTIVALLATVHAAPAKAQMCECVPPQVLIDDMQSDYYASASLIIIGTVGAESGAQAQMTVVEPFKGPLAGETVTVRSAQTECSYELAPPGSNHFVLALTEAEDGTPVTNRCTTFPEGTAEFEQVSAAARAAAQAAATPAPPGEPTAATTEPAETPAPTTAAETPESTPTEPSGEIPPDSGDDDDGASTTWLIVAAVSAAAAAVAIGVAAWMVLTGRRGSA